MLDNCSVPETMGPVGYHLLPFILNECLNVLRNNTCIKTITSALLWQRGEGGPSFSFKCWLFGCMHQI